LRLKPVIRDFIKSGLTSLSEDSKVFLFGSRSDDHKKGGDIDILWLTPEKVGQETIRKFRVLFYKKFGWQKIDVVNFTFDEKNAFRQVVISKAIEL
jgi:uncharacterized protein